MSDTRKPVIKSSDMTEEMQQDAVNTAVQVRGCREPPRRAGRKGRSTNLAAWPALFVAQALDKFTIEKDVAAYIKKEFDSKHSPTWHCIVGRNFGEQGSWRRLATPKQATRGRRRCRCATYISHPCLKYMPHPVPSRGPSCAIVPGPEASSHHVAHLPPVETQGHTSHMKQSTSFTSIWAQWQCCFLKAGNCWEEHSTAAPRRAAGALQEGSREQHTYAGRAGSW